MRGKADGVTALAPIRDRFPSFADLLACEPEADLFGALRAAESVGRHSDMTAFSHALSDRPDVSSNQVGAGRNRPDRRTSNDCPPGGPGCGYRCANFPECVVLAKTTEERPVMKAIALILAVTLNASVAFVFDPNGSGKFLTAIVSVRIDVTNSHMLDNSWGPRWRNANRIASRIRWLQ